MLAFVAVTWREINMTKASAGVDFDMIVVGAGLTGASLVACLGSLPLRILWLDQKPLKVTSKDDLDSRPLSLAYSSYRLLQQLGLWQACSHEGHQGKVELHVAPSLQKMAHAIAKVHVSEQDALFNTSFSAAEAKVSALGYVVPAASLHASLVQAARVHAEFRQIQKIERITPSEVNSAAGSGDTAAGGHVQVVYQDMHGQSQVVTAGMLLGADGRQSQARDLMGFTLQTDASEGVAITASLQCALQGCAYERFVPGGVLALLPQSEQRAGMVWVMSQQQADEALASWDAAAWQRAIKAAMRGHLSAPVKFEQVTAHYPLSSAWVNNAYKQRVFLLGDAAHTLFPLAAQGFNLSLRDVASFAECLAAQLNAEAGSVLSDAAMGHLADSYHRMRHPEQTAIRRFTQALVRIWRIPALPGVRLLRSCGLLGVGLCSMAKKYITNLCMGRTGHVPRLMRGLSLHPQLDEDKPVAKQTSS